ncbi:hypothetical protein ACF1A9_19615 [Streptomyces sp. NPDC014872]|uniref:hypothetical protein n=1 Tax=Streptomyces sp. NPDC014872 TaxID=3364926 RepID=UPI0036FBB3BC
MNALAVRLAPLRARAIEELADALAKWGADVPEDPGVAELAALLAETARHFPHDVDGRAPATAYLEVALEHLGAAVRLRSLLPLITCHHLRLALQQVRSSHLALGQAARSNSQTLAEFLALLAKDALDA